GTAARPVIATSGVRALAIAGPAPNDRRAPDASIAVSNVQTESRLLSRGLDPSVSCDEECLVEATVRLKGLVAGEASETIADGPGRRTIDIRLDALARRIIRRRGSVRMVLTVSASDSAGNRRTQTRFIRTR
ncbi:MAG: hypothetical protein H0T43_04815, partial [Solirubrobacterales bacterium]|nr:hypothetical protein [Solirubrobacterales bacterium]